MADKGGVGKSTAAVHIAGRLAQLRHSPILADLDGRLASSRWLRRAGDEVPSYQVSRGEVPPEAPTVVWDTPAHPSVKLRDALVEQCDVLLIVVADDLESQLAGVELYRDLLGRGGRPSLLLNMVHPSASTSALRRDLVEAGATVLPAEMRRYSCYRHAGADGRLVIDFPYPGADNAWSDVAAITDYILETAHVPA